jgi:lauroyl/myristoyl acyltransferase
VADQTPAGRIGDDVNFFGHQVALVGGPAAMSLRCEAVIVSVAVVRTGLRRFRLMGRIVFDPRQVTDPPTNAQVSQMCATEMERWIRLYPEQWTWEYKRWIFST